MAHYGSDDSYHYPTELLVLLQKCIPRLCPAKKDMFQFFRAAGVDHDIYARWESQWRSDPKSVGKYEIARDIINSLNERRTNAALRQRREIVKRVTAWENYSILWDEDRLPAKSLVAEIRKTVHKADAFTRMERERDQALREQREERRKKLEADRERREKRESIRREISALFSESSHQKRGKALESVLNRLFSNFGILVREAFTIQGANGEGQLLRLTAR